MGDLVEALLTGGLEIGMEKLTIDSPHDVIVVQVPVENVTDIYDVMMDAWDALWEAKGKEPPILVIAPLGYKFDVVSCAELLGDYLPEGP